MAACSTGKRECVLEGSSLWCHSSLWQDERLLQNCLSSQGCAAARTGGRVVLAGRRECLVGAVSHRVCYWIVYAIGCVTTL